ncbi:unnamed protein product [Durusdinium trenchii]
MHLYDQSDYAAGVPSSRESPTAWYLVSTTTTTGPSFAEALQNALDALNAKKLSYLSLLDGLENITGGGLLAQKIDIDPDGTITAAFVMAPPQDDSAVVLGFGDVQVEVPAATLEAFGGPAVAVMGLLAPGGALFDILNSSELQSSQDVVSLDIFVNGSAIGDLASPIHFTIPAELAGPADPTCAYLDEERQEWSTVGVSLINVTNTSLLCSTTHLSLFGGIMRSIEQALLCSNAAAIFSIEGLRSLTSRLWIFEWAAILNWIMLLVGAGLLGCARVADLRNQDRMDLTRTIASLKANAKHYAQTHDQHAHHGLGHMLEELYDVLDTGPARMIYSQMLRVQTGFGLKALAKIYQKIRPLVLIFLMWMVAAYHILPWPSLDSIIAYEVKFASLEVIERKRSSTRKLFIVTIEVGGRPKSRVIFQQKDDAFRVTEESFKATEGHLMLISVYQNKMDKAHLRGQTEIGVNELLVNGLSSKLPLHLDGRSVPMQEDVLVDEVEAGIEEADGLAEAAESPETRVEIAQIDEECSVEEILAQTPGSPESFAQEAPVEVHGYCDKLARVSSSTSLPHDRSDESIPAEAAAFRVRGDLLLGSKTWSQSVRQAAQVRAPPTELRRIEEVEELEAAGFAGGSGHVPRTRIPMELGALLAVTLKGEVGRRCRQRSPVPPVPELPPMPAPAPVPTPRITPRDPDTPRRHELLEKVKDSNLRELCSIAEQRQVLAVLRMGQEAGIARSSRKQLLITSQRFLSIPPDGVWCIRPWAASSGAGRWSSLALSVEFLCGGMLSELQVEKQQKVYDIEPEIRKVGKEVICPRDGKLGAAYVDVARDPHSGRATCMLSYTWGYEVHTISNTLMTHCRRLRETPQQIRVWICAFCVNQWRVQEAVAQGAKVPFEDFQAEFADKVLRRDCGCKRNVMNILTGSALDEQQLDALLKDQLKGADELAVEEACKEINLHVDRCLTGFSQIGWMCNQIGLYHEGLQSLNTGIDTAQAFYGASSKMSESNALALIGLLRAKAKLLTYRGMSYSKASNHQAFEEDFDNAYRLSWQAKELLEENDLSKTSSHYAEVLGDLSIWHGKKGDVGAAIDMGLLSKKAFEDSHYTETAMYGNILKSIGISYHRRAQVATQAHTLSDQASVASASTGCEEDYRLAGDMYAESEALFIRIAQDRNPWYLDLLTQRGKLLGEEGKQEEAREKFLLAKRQFEALGLQKSPQYEEVRELLAEEDEDCFST